MNKRTAIGVNCTPIENVPQRDILVVPSGANVSIEIDNNVFLKEIRVKISSVLSHDDIKAVVFMSHNYIVDRPHLLTISQKRSCDMNAHDRRLLNKDIERRIQDGHDMLLYDLLTYGYSNGYLC